jgi:hypothetical protein
MHKPTTPLRGVASATTPIGKGEWTFDGVLRRVLGMSRAMELDGATVRPSRSNGAAIDALRIFAKSLDTEIVQKLETLMRAGRDAQPLGPTSAALSKRGAEQGQAPPDLFEDRAASLENLRRGHAIACATRFDLESDVAKWPASLAGDSLDERVWLRFGRELAASSPADWVCLAQVGQDMELESLYLRRGKGSWWSFDTLIDRPSTRVVARRLDRPRRKRDRLITLRVDAVIGRRCRPDRPALHRAALAMSARLGSCRAG